MNIKVKLDHDVDGALQKFSTGKRFFIFKPKPINYELVIKDGVMKLKCDNGRKPIYITPKAVDMAGLTIHIGQEVYNYEELK